VVMSLQPSDRGTSSTEFAIVYSPLLGLVLTVVHFGFAYHASLVVADAADVALEAFQAEGGSAVDATRAADDLAGGDGVLSGLTVSAVANGSTVVISVSARSPSLMPGLPTQVSRTVSGPIERFVPEPDR
jgi:hypothetical protein